MAGMWLFGLLWLLIVGGVIWLIVRAILRGRPDQPVGAQPGQGTALVALRQRFAKGEIDEPEYRERRRVLDSGDNEASLSR